MIEGLRLIHQSDENVRKNGDIALANQAQFLLISEPSVKWLMQHVEDWDIVEDVENIVNRFRGNLIIDNIEALAENEWKTLKIGENEFEVQGPCTRCQMICIDQSTGGKTTEPLRTIGKLFQGKTRFGIYLKNVNFTTSNVLKCSDKIIYIQ
jgi:molybdenum cofactor sulfurtransferase